MRRSALPWVARCIGFAAQALDLQAAQQTGKAARRVSRAVIAHYPLVSHTQIAVSATPASLRRMCGGFDHPSPGAGLLKVCKPLGIQALQLACGLALVSPRGRAASCGGSRRAWACLGASCASASLRCQLPPPQPHCANTRDLVVNRPCNATTRLLAHQKGRIFYPQKLWITRGHSYPKTPKCASAKALLSLPKNMAIIVIFI